MARKECTPIVTIITIPPSIVSKLGFSLITIQTHIGPTITSNKKNKLTVKIKSNGSFLDLNKRKIVEPPKEILDNCIKYLKE